MNRNSRARGKAIIGSRRVCRAGAVYAARAYSKFSAFGNARTQSCSRTSSRPPARPETSAQTLA